MISKESEIGTFIGLPRLALPVLFVSFLRLSLFEIIPFKLCLELFKVPFIFRAPFSEPVHACFTCFSCPRSMHSLWTLRSPRTLSSFAAQHHVFSARLSFFSGEKRGRLTSLMPSLSLRVVVSKHAAAHVPPLKALLPEVVCPRCRPFRT